jgi:hypothetical protein
MIWASEMVEGPTAATSDERHRPEAFRADVQSQQANIRRPPYFVTSFCHTYPPQSRALLIRHTFMYLN